MTKPNFINAKFALTLSFALGLSACGSQDNANSIEDWAIDHENKDHQAQLMFVNTQEEMATFYIKSNRMNRDIFDNRQQVNSVLNGEAEDYTFKWSGGNQEDSKLGVTDTNSLTYQATLDIELKDKQDYWAIAWIDHNEYQLSAFEKTPLSTDGSFNVRIFSTVDLVKTTKNMINTPTDAIQKGAISTHFNIQNCATNLTHDDLNINIDICAIAEFGKSYLVIVDNEKQLFIGQE